MVTFRQRGRGMIPEEYTGDFHFICNIHILSSVVDIWIFSTWFSTVFYEFLEISYNIPTLDVNGIKWHVFLNLLFSLHIMFLVSKLRIICDSPLFAVFIVYYLHETFLLLVMYLHKLFIADPYNTLLLFFFFLFHIVSPTSEFIVVLFLSFLHTQNSPLIL